MSYTIPGPRTAIDWNRQFGRASEYPGFAHGNGTAFPFPSVPIAQIARWWWGVKSWRVVADVSVTTYPYSEPEIPNIQAGAGDSGWLPYGCGRYADGTLIKRNSLYWGWVPGDVTTYPTIGERYGDVDNAGLVTSFFFNGTGEDYSGPIDTVVSITPFMFAGIGAPSASYYGLSSVFDESTPGNAYFCFFLADDFSTIDGMSYDTFSDPIELVELGITVTLDGLGPIPTYYKPLVLTPPWEEGPRDIRYSYGTGNIAIYTSDAEPEVTGPFEYPPPPEDPPPDSPP